MDPSQQLELDLRTLIIPNKTAILQTDGVTRRAVTMNHGRKIRMVTGRTTNQQKSIDYDIVHFADTVIAQGQHFDCNVYKLRYPCEYADRSCRFSMVGGVLVELGRADLVTRPRGHTTSPAQVVCSDA